MSDLSVGTLGASGKHETGSQSQALQNLDKDTFLKLLVAQMKYQNPMSPVDSNEFLAQAAQYAAVEQLENVAESQAELRSLQMVTIATGLVGQEVTAQNSFTGEMVTGRVQTVRFGAEPILVVDGVDVPLSAIVSVSDTPGDASSAVQTPAPNVRQPQAADPPIVPQAPATPPEVSTAPDASNQQREATLAPPL